MKGRHLDRVNVQQETAKLLSFLTLSSKLLDNWESSDATYGGTISWGSKLSLTVHVVMQWWRTMIYCKECVMYLKGSATINIWFGLCHETNILGFHTHIPSCVLDLCQRVIITGTYLIPCTQLLCSMDEVSSIWRGIAVFSSWTAQWHGTRTHVGLESVPVCMKRASVTRLIPARLFFNRLTRVWLLPFIYLIDCSLAVCVYLRLHVRYYFVVRIWVVMFVHCGVVWPCWVLHMHWLYKMNRSMFYPFLLDHCSSLIPVRLICPRSDPMTNLTLQIVLVYSSSMLTSH